MEYCLIDLAVPVFLGRGFVRVKAPILVPKFPISQLEVGACIVYATFEVYFLVVL